MKNSPAMQVLTSELNLRLQDRVSGPARGIEQASRPARIVQAIIDQLPQVPEPRDPPTVTADGGDLHIHWHVYAGSADDE